MNKIVTDLEKLNSNNQNEAWNFIKILMLEQNGEILTQYKHLDKLEPEVRSFIIKVLNLGKKDLYHSVSAFISTKWHLSPQEIYYEYMNKYKANYFVGNEDIMKKLIIHIYKKNDKRTKNKNRIYVIK